MQLHKWSKNVINVKNCQYLKGNCQFFSVMSEMKTVFFYNSSLVLFTACFYHFLFWRYLNSSMTSFSSDILLPSISKFKWFEQPRQRPPITPSNNLENKILSDIYWRVQLVCIKLQTYKSGPDQMPFWWIKVCYDLFNHLRVTEILCSFRLVLKMGKQVKKYGSWINLKKLYHKKNKNKQSSFP